MDKKPTPIPVPNRDGYPNNTPSTQTKPMRGAGAAQRGNKFSKNSQ